MNIHAVASDGANLLMTAVDMGTWRYQSSLSSVSMVAQLFLHFAVENRLLSISSEKVNIFALQTVGRIPLMLAVCCDCKEICKILIDPGA